MEEAADPGAAPPVPDALPEGQAMQAVAALSQRRGSALTRFAVWAFTALFGFALSVAAYDFVTGLLARNVVLGWAAFALVVVAALAGLVLALREWGAFLRLKRLDGLRDRALTARAAADLKDARRVVAGLVGLYGARGDTAWGRARLAEREGEVMDADALLSLAERELLTTLDAEARLVIEGAARQVATVTALVPLALADVAVAAVANLRMIRRIAEIYGGRSGSFGSLKLLRRVFGSLVAAGALALTDDMIGSVAGGGVLSKLSRRFGEGVVNGALTARVGVAAMELCRPMPFVALERPAVSSLVSRALAGLVSRG
ncbi:YcjF family protein [Tabrizicola sp.]|uniref:YcjF family protein n=1 Tax=Tabrizicola sp. TaxID=2005166 RepID=UPI0027340A6C|nr:TIGR01620 family protein [Tabrizicola sp.]MDP3196028.1 TIGR01620 family protein [Tabrizicola sp.]